jgi:EAL and modified HD-GYP domain-containing signal transduction protein
MDYLLSRHPIYKSRIDVAGYEIRSRPITNDPNSPPPPEAARAIFGKFTEAELDHIVGAHPCFISMTPEALAEGLWKGIPTARVVLCYFDDFPATGDIASVLTELTQKGCRIALSEKLNTEALDVLGPHAYVIKVDVTQYTPDVVEQRFHQLKQYKTKILADKIDTYDDFEFCKDLGFDLYQGHFISRAAGQRKEVSVNRLTMMRVLSKLQDPEMPMAELEKVISLDVALSFKLLSYANSPAVALKRNVSSVGHAMRLIGTDMLRTWASVLLLSSVDDKPRELMTIALVRAKMCERLSESLKDPHKDSFFSAGLLSVLDALLDCPMEKAVEELPLVDEVKAALINKSGPIGQALRCTVAYERADWDEVQFYGMPAAPIRDIYLEALAWTRKLSSGLLP